MRAPIISAAAAALMLASCDNGPAGDAPNGPVSTGRANTTIDTTNGEAVAVQAGDIPVRGTIPRFVGKWAADQKSCQTAAWQFTDTTLSTPAGSSCTFENVTEVSGGYDIQATCTAEALPAPDTIEVRFAESAKSMLFSSNSIADAGLVFCGRDV